MHRTVRVLVFLTLVLPAAGVIPAFAAPPTDACSLMTAAEVGSALGSTVAKGTYVMPGFTKTCTWTIPTGGGVIPPASDRGFLQRRQRRIGEYGDDVG